MFSFSNICFYGGGAWGQALAITLASLGHKSTLIVSDQIRADEINSHTSKKFPHIQLSYLINASVNASATIKKSNLVFITTESKRVIDVVKQIFLLKDENISLVITSKGFATMDGKTFNEIIKDEFPTLKTGILTGPTFADEIANNLPAAAVLASNDIALANSICSLFQNSCLRLYQSNDPVGASIAGAVKNIIAIGAGMIEGLNLGDNAKAALITRGISETSRLIKTSGGNYNTAFGLAGIGDMSLTCSGPHSRNMAYGINLVKGNNATNTLDLVEGVNAIGAAIALAEKLKIELPIVNAINQILNKKGNIKEIISQLLSRPIKDEF
jgi:glycerol-3-phosphate dehydrogenase (NAD(P)+)